MKRMFLLVLTFAAFGLGNKGCDEPAPQLPEDFTAEDLAVALDFAIAGAEFGNYFAVRDKDFDGCMITSGILCGLNAAEGYAPQVEAEIKAPDGMLAFPAFEFDGTACEPFKPEEWPPTEPNPDLEAILSPMISGSLLMGATLVESQAPESGEGCVRAKVAAAVMRSLATQMTGIMAEAMVDADLVLAIASFDVSYESCQEDNVD